MGDLSKTGVLGFVDACVWATALKYTGRMRKIKKNFFIYSNIVSKNILSSI